EDYGASFTSAAAGGGVLLALLAAAVVATCNALSSAALAVRHPAAGGTYLYGRERLGDLPGYLAGWCFVVGKTASCAAMAMTAGAYLVPGQERLAAVAAVVVVTALNLSGVQRSARASTVIVSIVLAVLAGLVLAALVGAGGDGPGWSWRSLLEQRAAAGYDGVLQAAGLLFFAFAGYARVATLAEEVREPARVIPRAVVTALGVVLIAYVAVGVTTLGTLGASATAASSAPVAEAAAVLWGGQWAWVVRLAAGLAALGALLNLLLGISRTGLAMARGGHLPRALGVVAGPHAVPRVAELAVGCLVTVVVLLADLRGAIGFSSFGVLLYYAVTNASALTLRGDWRGAPWVPVLGGAGCLTLAASLPWASVAAGLAVVAIGLGWYRVRGRFGAGPGTGSA
ncbi:APC family permease, partial [Ornithinicoccus halotolerans]|uniref:APC family permease n=1 Tax=Ornithinicoccus halotolerans TaxID=1748220 RepID=UPI001297ADAA